MFTCFISFPLNIPNGDLILCEDLMGCRPFQLSIARILNPIFIIPWIPKSKKKIPLKSAPRNTGGPRN